MPSTNEISMEYGQWISFTEVKVVPLDIDYFWSRFPEKKRWREIS